MVDITAKLFWYRTKEWYENMADKLNDIVYTDDSKETVDVINLLLLGWILLGLIVYIIGTVIATQLRKRKATFSSSETEFSDEKAETTDQVSCASEIKSAAPEVLLEPTKVQKPFTIPTCSGEEQEIVEWINNVFSWIYKNRVISPVIDAWISALNARTRLLSTEHGILVDFKDIAVSSEPPDVQEATEICTTRGDLNLLCDMEIENINFDVTVTQVKERDKTVTPFLLNVKRIYGKVNMECIPEDLSFVAKYSEVPQIELSAEPVKDTNFSAESSQTLNDVVCEICSEAFSSAIVDLKFSCYPECPRLTLKSTASEEEVFESAENETEEKLLVKIIKATDLGGSEGCLQPYCVVEMDEPPEKFETKALEEKSNPFWDESFTFTVKDVSAELLFEIYDKGKPSKENFLGLGIVSVDELIRNPSQRQIIPLQSRPLEDDNVTGSLTTEFLFLNQISPVTEPTHFSQKTVASDGKTIETNSRVTAGGTVITTTTIKRTKEENFGKPEVACNAKAFAVQPILTPVHEFFEELLKKKYEQNVLLASLQDSNEKKNDSCIEVSSNKINQNGSVTHLVNGTASINCNKQNGITSVVEKNNSDILAEKEQNNSTLPEILLSNGVPKFACPPMHVHDEINNSFILNHNTVQVESVENNLDSGETTPVLETNDTKLHDMAEILGPILLLNASSYDHDMNSSLPSIEETVENSSTSSKSLENNKDVEADLTGTALKELEKISKPNNSTSKSTLIIHSVQRQADSSISESLEASPASHLSKDSHTSYSESVPSSPSHDQSGDDRSRSKDKKSLFGSLRRRLSFRKARSKSAENRSESSNYSQGSSRSASSDRLRPKSQKPSPLKGKFIGIPFLAVPGSTRSSLSEVSGISGASSRTYINENSTLVIETNENGIIKRYLIPNSLIHRSKWKKRGTKLHIYNDHVFVAKHLSGSTTCKVCQKYLTRRPGKQGYECRGCNLQCHKSCHVKVENYCSNTSINSMEVEYIHDPKGATPKSI